VVETVALPIDACRLRKVDRALVQKPLCSTRAFPSRFHPDRVSMDYLWRIVRCDSGRYFLSVPCFLCLWNRLPLPQNFPTLCARLEGAASLTL